MFRDEQKPPTASNILEILFQVFEEMEVIVIRPFGPGTFKYYMRWVHTVR